MYDWATPLLSKDFDGFVYFDLGGVVFDWHWGLENVAKLANKTLAEVKEVFLKHDNDACKGLISPQEFGKIYEKELSFTFGDADFSLFWVNSFSPIQETHRLMHELALKNVPMGIITNIYRGTYEKALGKSIPNLKYKTVIKSCDCGLIKPDPKFLELAEKACGFEKSKITLIDDNQDNITAATNFGWNGILFETR